MLTTAAAGSLLCALWFVPSANATVETHDSSAAAPAGQAKTAQQYAVDSTGSAQTASTGSAESIKGEDLADTGSVDVVPYVIGGTVFLGLGVAMVTASMRRMRPEPEPA
jgi:hypothetical protein